MFPFADKGWLASARQLVRAFVGYFSFFSCKYTRNGIVADVPVSYGHGAPRFSAFYVMFT